MTPTADKVAAFVALAVQVLTPDERVTLAGELFDLANSELAAFEQSEAFKAEINRRIASTEPGIPWEVLRANALARTKTRHATEQTGE